MANISNASTRSPFSCCFNSPSEVEDDIERLGVSELDARLQRLETDVEDCAWNASHVDFVRLPIELAGAVLTADGQISVEACRAIRKEFLPTHGRLEEHPNSALMYAVLRRLEDDDEFRTGLEEVTLNLHLHGDVVVRSTLGLSPTEKLNVSQVRQVVLSALLTEVRQGSSGSCFGTGMLIREQHNDLDQCLQDFSDLLSEGCLRRTVAGEPKSFPYLLKAPADCWKATGCAPTGFLGMESEHFSVCPLYKGLATTGGIDLSIVKRTAKIASSAAAWEPFRSVKSPHIDRLVRHLSELPTSAEKAGLVFSRMALAHAAMTEHPLLAVWQNSVAGMAEATENCSQTAQLSQWCLRFLDSIGLAGADAYDYLDLLLERTRYLFDPGHRHVDGANNGKYESAFVLYDTHGSRDFSEWQAVDNPTAFRTLVTSAFTKGDNEQLIKTIKELSTEDFFHNLHYDERDERPEELLEDYTQLKHTLWVNYRGHHPRRVTQIYHNLKKKPRLVELEASSADSLITEIAEHVKALPPSTQDWLHSEPRALLPLETSTHAFSLLAGEPRLQGLWESGSDPDYWCWTQLVKPGLKIANKTVDADTQKRFIECVKDKLAIDQYAFGRACAALPAELSTSELYQAVADLLEGNCKDTEKYDATLESLLVSSLPEKQRQALFAQAVPFADLNYIQNWTSHKHKYLAFIFNPGTRLIDIWPYVRGEEASYANWLNGEDWETY